MHMSIIRPISTIFAIVALAAHSALARNEPAAQSAQGGESFVALNKEHQDALHAWVTEFTAARAAARENGREKEPRYQKTAPITAFAARFLAFAERAPEGPDAIYALKMAIKSSYGPPPDDRPEIRTRAYKIIQDFYVTKPEIKVVVSLLTGDNPETNKLRDAVIARNPDRKIHALFIKKMIASNESMVRFGERLNDPKYRAELELTRDKAKVAGLLDDSRKARAKLVELKKALSEQYSEFAHELLVGEAAPELVIEGITGKKARLSALKGKVVVLDIWTTWCGPCKAMIPHERAMVERLKDKPFVLVSISADDKKETLVEFLAHEKMPWTHWWNIQGFPTVYVLDAEGVIRYKHLGFEKDEFDKAVNELLNETTTTVKPATKAATPATAT
jgi:thiol-disulfide isomerase/thioredoxin